LLYLSGHLPVNADGSLHTGQLTDNETDVTKGYAAAQAVALNLLATIHQHVQGDWTKVASIVKLFGIVNSADSFTNQHLVLNGASDLMVQVVGGVHARSAIGTNTLPLGITVEIEAIVQLKK
jgi:enamine deaminase RidA (YjgF/YER057c/UK114 family)